MTLFDELFFNFPTVSKPPFDSFPRYDEKTNKVIGSTVQFALAGMKKEQISVSLEGRNLRIKGDNTKSSDISSKFMNNFDWKLALTEKSDADNCEIIFEDGLLSIYIPYKKPTITSKILF